MPRGGKREGAGRRAGSATTKTREIADKAAGEGITPLEYMLDVMRDDTATEARRDWAAEKAAPYLHAKLAAMTLSGDPDNPLDVNVRLNAERFTSAIARLAARSSSEKGS